MIRILSNYRCRAGCSTSSHGRLPPPYEGLETALVRRQRWPGAVVQKHRDVITVTRVKRQKCIKHADLCGFLRMKKSILYTFFFFFSVDGSASFRMVLWLLVAEKPWEILRFFAGLESKKSKRGQQERRARPCWVVEPLSTGSTPLQSWKNMEYLEKKP